MSQLEEKETIVKEDIRNHDSCIGNSKEIQSNDAPATDEKDNSDTNKNKDHDNIDDYDESSFNELSQKRVARTDPNILKEKLLSPFPYRRNVMQNNHDSKNNNNNNNNLVSTLINDNNNINNHRIGTYK